MKERVRELTAEEIPGLIGKLKLFEAESCFVKVDVSYGVLSCLTHLGAGTGAVFGLFDRAGEIIGGLGCIKGPQLHNGEMTAVETFWFVEPGKRGNGLKLMEAFEKWAIDNQCLHCAMIHLVDSHPESLQRLYKMNDYHLAELHYIKRLKGTVP